MKECDSCGKSVEDWDLDRWGDCPECKAKSKATDMTVGDLNSKP